MVQRGKHLFDARQVLIDEDQEVWLRLERATRLLWLGYMFGGSEWPDELREECTRQLGLLMAEGNPRTTIATLDERTALQMCAQMRELIDRIEGT